MKPFDLQKALDGAPVVTRGGEPVIIAGCNEEALPGRYIAGWIDGEVASWFKDGRIYRDVESLNDLFMETKKREEWANVYRTKEGHTFIGHLYPDEETAKEIAGQIPVNELLTTIKIEWEE